MNRILISLVVIFFFTECSNKLTDYPDDKLQVFFEQFGEKPDEAIKKLLKQNRWISDGSGENVSLELKNYIKDIGVYYGYEVVSKKNLGKSLCIYSVLVKYDRQPVRFTFIYYKSEKEWMIQNFLFDGEINEELIKSTEIFLLKNVYSQ
jgi:hypothetical protein